MHSEFGHVRRRIQSCTQLSAWWPSANQTDGAKEAEYVARFDYALVGSSVLLGIQFAGGGSNGLDVYVLNHPTFFPLQIHLAPINFLSKHMKESEAVFYYMTWQVGKC